MPAHAQNPKLLQALASSRRSPQGRLMDVSRTRRCYSWKFSSCPKGQIHAVSQEGRWLRSPRLLIAKDPLFGNAFFLELSFLGGLFVGMEAEDGPAHPMGSLQSAVLSASPLECPCSFHGPVDVGWEGPLLKGSRSLSFHLFERSTQMWVNAAQNQQLSQHKPRWQSCILKLQESEDTGNNGCSPEISILSTQPFCQGNKSPHPTSSSTRKHGSLSCTHQHPPLALWSELLCGERNWPGLHLCHLIGQLEGETLAK